MALRLAREGAAAEQVTGGEWPNDGKGNKGDASAAVAFGRLAVSPTLERLPLRKADGSFSADMDEERFDSSESIPVIRANGGWGGSGEGERKRRGVEGTRA